MYIHTSGAHGLHQLLTCNHTLTQTRHTHSLIQYYTNDPTLYAPTHLVHLCKHACPHVWNHSLYHPYLYIHSPLIKIYPSHSPRFLLHRSHRFIYPSNHPLNHSPYSILNRLHDPLTHPCIHTCIHQPIHLFIHPCIY